MISYIKNKGFIKTIVLSSLIVAFVKYFYFIPSISFFILFLVVLILNFWHGYFARIFVFLSLTVAIMSFIPNISTTYIKFYFDNNYSHIISLVILICLISFIGGHCFAQKRGAVNCYYLLCQVLICFSGAYLFKDVLLYDEILLLIFLFVIATIFAYLGSSHSCGFHNYLITRSQNIAFLFCLAIVFILSNYYSQKPISKVGLIECFSQWADTKTNYTVKEITLKSGYSYSLMKEVLQNKYSLVSIDARGDLKKVLPTLDVALIITPTMPFEVQEAEAVKEFVTNGGRLVVVADHTDLYGHGRVINSLLKGTGINVEYNALFDATDHYAKVRLPNMRMYSIRPKTPCSLSMTRPGYIWGWTSNWISETADYTNPNFFGEFSWTADDLVGNLPVGGIVKYGKGKIVLWCDSTIFANFCIFQPDHLRLLGNLIEGGKILAILSPYGMWLLMFSIFVILSIKLTKINIVTFCSFGLVIFSGCYYLWDFKPENFYSKNKRIDVYGTKDLFEEPPPKSIPKEDKFSSAYSHIARCGLYPFYMGEKPKRPVLNKSIWITSWDKVLSIDSKIYNSLWGIIIMNLDDNIQNVDFNEICIDDDINDVFKEFFNPESQTRRMLVTDKFTHTLIYNGVSIFAAHGVITDRYFGDWWITTNISPYRLFMLNEWFDWLIRKDDISKFDYPRIGIKAGEEDWLIKFENKDYIRIKMTVDPYEKNQNYVYLGSGIWALYEKNIDGKFLLGGIETSDNYLKSSNVRWAAQAITKNQSFK